MSNATRLLPRALGLLSIALCAAVAAQSATPAGAADPKNDAEIPADVLEFIAAGEEARLEMIDYLVEKRARLKRSETKEAADRLREVEVSLARCRKPEEVYTPILSENLKVGHKGRLWYPYVTIAQVIDENQAVVKVTYNSNTKKTLSFIMRGIATKDLADGQKYTITAPLSVTGTDDVNDGSRRRLLVLEELDMQPYEEHWEAALKELKKRRKKPAK